MVGQTTTMSMILDPPKVHEFMMQIGVKKAHLKLYKIILMGMISGFFGMVGAHGMISMLSGEGTPGTALTLLSGMVFAVGLMGIVLAGGELFTGNCLLIVAVLSKRIKWWEMALDLLIVFFSNFLGNILWAVVIFGTGLYGWGYGNEQTPHSRTLCNLVHKKTHPPAFELFFRGILANFMVCLAILLSWCASSASGKVISMVWPIAVFVVSGYEHSIANQGIFTLATLVNCPTPHGWYWVNLAVVTPGNILGAFAIGVTYYFISIWGTDLSLKHTPIYGEDGVTICDYCASVSVNRSASLNKDTSVVNAGRVSFSNGTFVVRPDPLMITGNCCQKCSQSFRSQIFRESVSKELQPIASTSEKSPCNEPTHHVIMPPDA